VEIERGKLSRDKYGIRESKYEKRESKRSAKMAKTLICQRHLKISEINKLLLKIC